MNKRILATLLWIALSGVGLAQEPRPLDLAGAYRLALRSSPTLQKLQQRSEESRYRIDEAFAPGNPRAEFQTRLTHITPELNFGPFPLIVNDNYSAGLTLEQTIHTFGRLKWATEAARLAHQATLQDQLREKQRIAYETALLYSRVQTADAALEVAQSRIASRQRLVQDLNLRVQAGSSARFEQLVAEVTLAEDQHKLLEAEQRCSLLRDQLRVKVGLPLASEIRLAPLGEPEEVSAEVGLDQALERRPEMKAVNFAIAAARAKVSYEESQSAPQLGAFTRFELRNSTAFQTSNQWTTGLQLSVPLWDGGLTAARSHQAKAALAQIEAGGRELRQQMTLQLQEARTHQRLSQRRSEVARANLKRAEEALRIGELRFQAGVGTHQEVLDIQAHAAEAHLAWLEAQQAVREAGWELLWVTSGRFPFEDPEN